jgi:hypothetical protein
MTEFLKQGSGSLGQRTTGTRKLSIKRKIIWKLSNHDHDSHIYVKQKFRYTTSNFANYIFLLSG